MKYDRAVKNGEADKLESLRLRMEEAKPDYLESMNLVEKDRARRKAIQERRQANLKALSENHPFLGLDKPTETRSTEIYMGHEVSDSTPVQDPPGI
jgi:hypothetical protein